MYCLHRSVIKATFSRNVAVSATTVSDYSDFLLSRRVINSRYLNHVEVIFNIMDSVIPVTQSWVH